MVRFALLSDVHVTAHGVVPARLPAVVAALRALGPRFVVLSGDMTSGNQGDGCDLGRVRSWWQQLEGALAPLRDAGIALLPIAGNHDYYTDAHRRAFAEAAPRLAAGSPFADAVAAPRPYAIDVDGLHLQLLHVVDQELEPEVATWLDADLEGPARAAALRLCVGHIPLRSAMGRSSESFCNRLGGALVRGGVAAYFCGHEHLVWDEVLSIGGGSLRQVTVSTGSGTYQFPLRGELCAAHCQGSFGTLPATGAPFAFDPHTRNQRHALGFTIVEVEGSSYTVTPMTLDDHDAARPFDERALVGWLQGGLRRALGLGDDDLPLSASYDAATVAAVRRFQQTAGLVVDGDAGPRTQEKLRERIG